jgi:hypothetical protein
MKKRNRIRRNTNMKKRRRGERVEEKEERV